MRRTAAVLISGVMALLFGLAGCGSSNPSASGVTGGTGGQTSTSATSGTATDSHCEAVLAFLSSSTTPDVSKDSADNYRVVLQTVDQARAEFPTELDGSLQAVADFAQSELDRVERGEPDPLLTGGPDDLQRLATALVTYSQAASDIETWSRHQCGPPSAASPWCDSVGQGQAAIAKDYAAGIAAPGGSTAGAALLDQSLLDFYRALRAAAPEGLHASLDVIIQQYESNGGREPTDDAAQSARDAAKSTISAAIATDCGDQLSHLD